MRYTYKFKKRKDEDILLISDNAVLKRDDVDDIISVIVTNKRLLLFSFPNQVNNYEEVLRQSRLTNYIKDMNLILELELDSIKEIIKLDDYDKYLLKDTNYFYLKDDKIRKEILKHI